MQMSCIFQEFTPPPPSQSTAISWFPLPNVPCLSGILFGNKAMSEPHYAISATAVAQVHNMHDTLYWMYKKK